MPSMFCSRTWSGSREWAEPGRVSGETVSSWPLYNEAGWKQLLPLLACRLPQALSPLCVPSGSPNQAGMAQAARPEMPPTAPALLPVCAL